jgi:polyferredoxin
MEEIFEQFIHFLMKTFGLNGFIFLKDMFVFISAFIGGILVQLLLDGVIWNNVVSDNSLKNIAVLRVKKDGRFIYYTNPETPADIVHKTILIGLMKLSRGKKITIANARRSKITTYMVIFLLMSFFVSGLLVAMHQVDVLKWLEILDETR